MFLSFKKKKTRMSFFSTSIQHCVLYATLHSMEVPANTVRWEEIQGKQFGKAAAKLALIINRIIQVENLMEYTEKLFDSQRSLSKVAEYKLNTQKSVGFYILATIIINWSLKTIYHSLDKYFYRSDKRCARLNTLKIRNIREIKEKSK